MASHLGMSIDRCMEEHTSRQIRVWMAWLDLQWNKPTKADHYRMQIAMMLSDGKHGLDDFKIEFRERNSAPVMTVEQATAMAKARWGAVMGTSARKDGRL